MSPDLRAALRTLATALPADTPVPVPAGQLVALLDATGQDAAPAEADELLTVAEAARRLAVPPAWVYARAARLPFVRRLGPATLRVSEVGLRRWLARRRDG